MYGLSPHTHTHARTHFWGNSMQCNASLLFFFLKPSDGKWTESNSLAKFHLNAVVLTRCICQPNLRMMVRFEWELHRYHCPRLEIKNTGSCGYNRKIPKLHIFFKCVTSNHQCMKNKKHLTIKKNQHWKVWHKPTCHKIAKWQSRIQVSLKLKIIQSCLFLPLIWISWVKHHS